MPCKCTERPAITGLSVLLPVLWPDPHRLRQPISLVSRLRDGANRAEGAAMDSGRVRRAGRLVTTASLVTAFGLLTALNGTAAGARAAQAGLASRSTAATAAPGICQSARHPVIAARMSSRILAALAGRSSVVGLAVDDRVNGITCKLHPHWQFDSASVVKVTILS